jgi:glycosyltransferase involved in cell wall biosynthesis
MSSLSIILPAYNEEANIAAAVEEVSRVAQALGRDYEIILVNDGSRDRTGEIARAKLATSIPNFRLVEHFPNRGYGGALKAGFAAATKDLIAFVPADKQFKFDEVGLLLAALTQDVTLVSGWRVHRQDNLIRRLNGLGWNTVVRFLFGRTIHDIDCGFKVFRREVLSHIHIESNGAMIDTEMLAEIKARGYRISEVPVTHLPRVAGSPTGANLKVILRAFRDLFKFRLRLWRELREERHAVQSQS